MNHAATVLRSCTASLPWPRGHHVHAPHRPVAALIGDRRAVTAVEHGVTAALVATSLVSFFNQIANVMSGT